MIKSFLTRLLTSGFILIIFAFIFVASFFNIAFEIAISIIAAFCIYEVINAIGYADKKRFLIPSILYAVLVPVSFIFAQYVSKSAEQLMIIITFVYLVVFLIISMCNFERMKFNDAATISFASVVITCFLSNIILLRKIETHGLLLMIMVIVCFAWATDIFAYLVGICIGKHKFAPNISPKKSIEGCIGGTVFSMIATVIALLIYQKVTGCKIDYLVAMIYALACSFIGQIGDLSFSYIKRSYGIKDFGKLLPGHGGVLDRLDSLIFICPLFFVLISIKGFIL